MNSKHHRRIATAIVGLTFAASAAVYPYLPERIPIHWNFRGEIDGWGSRATVFLMPVVSLMLLGLVTGLTYAAPKDGESPSSKLVYGRVTVALAGLLAFIQAMILYSSFEREVSGRVLIAGICVFLGLLGNQLGKIDRNTMMGVRTPWTLASDRVWIATHRFAAWLAVASAAAGFVLTLFAGVPPWVAFIVIMAGFIYPAIHSYFIHRRFEREGTL